MKRVLIKIFIGISIMIILSFICTVLVYIQFSSISKGNPIPEYSNENPALLVIDIQEGTTGDISISEGLNQQANPFIHTVNRIIKQADSLQIPILYVYHENTYWLLNLITQGVMAKGAPGTAIDSRIRVVTENIFSKNKMDAFSNSDLDSFFLKHEVNHLYMTGLSAAQCVDRTSRAALKRGYHVTVIRDAVIAETVARKEEMLEKYKQIGIDIVASENWWEGAD